MSNLSDPDFKRYLEVRMHELRSGIEELIDMHDKYHDTLQKGYLYRARGALDDGLGWFEWERNNYKPKVVT